MTKLDAAKKMHSSEFLCDRWLRAQKACKWLFFQFLVGWDAQDYPAGGHML
jgi:hypothetical protein